MTFKEVFTVVSPEDDELLVAIYNPADLVSKS